MAISLETQHAPQAPIVKLNAIGQILDGVLAHAEQRNQQTRRDGIWVNQTKPDGTPRREEILHLIVKSGTAQLPAARGSDDLRQVEPDEHVRVIVKGAKWAKRIEAYSKLDGGMQVGDLLRIRVVDAIAVNESGVIAGTECTTNEQVLAQRVKGRNISFGWAIEARRARPEEADLVHKAEALYLALTTKATPLEPAAPTARPEWVDDGEEPF